MITYRDNTTPQQFQQVCTLEMLIWKTDPLDVISAHMQRVILHVGGCNIGAYDGDELVGFVTGLPAQDGRLWSHIAGVHPAYQGRGIGHELKQKQRLWAIEQGYTRMSWTFDPLLRVNARFNLHRLGATSNRYHVDFYGAMNDGVNAGLPSDRLEMTWTLDADRQPVPESAQSAPLLLIQDATGRPERIAEPSADWHRVQIPHDFPQIKRDDLLVALAWRHALRETLVSAFSAGYTAVDLHQGDDGAYYILKA